MFCGVRRYLLMFVVDDFVITLNLGNECILFTWKTCIIIFLLFMFDMKCCIFVDSHGNAFYTDLLLIHLTFLSVPRTRNIISVKTWLSTLEISVSFG